MFPSAPNCRARYNPLTFVLGAACAGIVLDRAAGVSLPGWCAIGVGGLGAWLALGRGGHNRAAAAAVLAAAGALAGAWHELRWSWYAADDLGRFARPAPQPACVEAVVRKGPRRVAPRPPDPLSPVAVGERTRLELEAAAIRDGAGWIAARGRVGLTVDGQLVGVHPGDRVRVFGSLSSPRRAANPGDFDQVGHLRGARKHCRLWASHPDAIRLLQRAPRRGPWWWVDRVRTGARSTLWRNLPAERADLAAAVLLGVREEIDAETTDIFIETGTVHLLAVSGLHVGMFAGVFLVALRALPLRRITVFWTVAALSGGYTLLTDAQPPAIRAAILIAVLCFARAIRRPPSPWNTLAAAGLVILALNPADLFNTGVHLSFLAVTTLIWLRPQWFSSQANRDPLDRLIEQSRSRGERLLRWSLAKFGRAAFVSAAVWMVTLPLVMSRFHVAAFGAAVVNPMIGIPMTAALVFGFLLILAGCLLPPATTPLAWACAGSLATLQAMIEWVHRVPGNHVWVKGLPDWWLVAFYAVFGTFAFCLRHRRAAAGWVLAAVAVWIAVGGLANHRRGVSGRLSCTFLSVGHGAAVLLEMPDGAVLLYDAGRLDAPQIGARGIAACLWEKRINAIDAIIISHGDTDHFNAVPELIRRFPTERVYVGPGMFASDQGAIRHFRGVIGRHRIPSSELVAGDRFRAGEATVGVLHPPSSFRGESDNAASLVLVVEYQGRRILLTGDLEGLGMEMLLAGSPLPCDVLLAPHHGSWRSDAAGLAAWCSPLLVVVSGHRDPRQAALESAYRQVGAELIYTGERGAVEVTIENGELRVRTHL
ncbi:MAG: ComEC/Rec2 family competence protein [Pirellulales bacterium]|jgi:competence protein ComEC|nr:ComEC/Rec2 family competence protein [Thermoguttaceae bacterium]MDD4786407.1 ComEC/Rec2 family competence protein [Pirellulales bacterium]NLY99782.1 ComEC/Rec2 family competence protein [Pirellulaceae bacterium]